MQHFEISVADGSLYLVGSESAGFHLRSFCRDVVTATTIDMRKVDFNPDHERFATVAAAVTFVRNGLRTGKIH